MNTKYIVKDRKGEYQSAYNLKLGKQKAYDWAVQCAKSVNGVVYLVDEDKKTEQEVFRVGS
ncbi:MAG: hypothetical protein RI886_893 [Pseudomonadota bacterium]|jgi:hypothetical protein